MAEKTKVYLVGIGLGNRDTLTLGAWEILQRCDRLIGARRMLECFPDLVCPKIEAVQPEKIAAELAAHPEEEAAVVLSGDVGFYSGAKKLYEHLAGFQVETVSGLSSVAYFCGKLRTSWEDVCLASTHGRDCNVTGLVRNHAKTFFLTGGDWQVGDICRALAEDGLGDVKISVGQRLSYPDEKIVTDTAAALAGLPAEEFHSLAVVLAENPSPFTVEYAVHGMEDSCFTRSGPDQRTVPMTKSEVRAVSLSKLRLKEHSVVYDIGAGTGSVAVEAAFRARYGTVYAIEKNPNALELLEENQTKFNLSHLKIVSGTAPDALEELPAPDCAFIGGSSGSMDGIIRLLLRKNPGIRLVVNAIALETISETLDSFRQNGITDVDIAQVSVAKSRPVGGYSMMMGQNPVYVLSGTGAGHG